MWLKTIFLKYAVPLLLLIDANIHTMSLELVDLCQANNVNLFCLPPHTTHALQPLDIEEGTQLDGLIPAAWCPDSQMCLNARL